MNKNFDEWNELKKKIDNKNIEIKLSKETFIGIPLTSKQKEGSYYFSFNFKGKTSVAMFNQIRVFDIRREKVFYGRISQNTFDNLKKKFLGFIKDS